MPRIRRWALDSEVGHASSAEIDEVGIIAALRLAGMRALAAIAARGIVATVVLLDGSHDWLTPPPATLFDHDADQLAPPVTTRVKADLTCAAVAAASVLAKVERDAWMLEAHVRHPEYGWAENKGYASPGHRDALAAHGPCALHRRTWSLPTSTGPGEADPQAVLPA